jgi:hypothetical protein
MSHVNPWAQVVVFIIVAIFAAIWKVINDQMAEKASADDLLSTHEEVDGGSNSSGIDSPV